uniref:N-acetylgalactosaminide beta-1,3-galactosyltransferase n=1 Tax=Panagrolaimus sp. JU765 TaxID=591449 RepID=A0AC34R3N9_9BILA
MIRRAKLNARSGFLPFVVGFACACVLFVIQGIVISKESRDFTQKLLIGDENDVLEDENEDEDQDDGDDGHEHNKHMFQHVHEDNEVAKSLKESVKVLCWIMTAKKNVEKAITVNSTWAPRCNKYVFITANETLGLPNVELKDVKEGREFLWAKTKAAFEWIYKNEINNYDWFLKADDDTYVVMENLRFMLLAHDPEKPTWFGCRFKPFTKQGYMSGGSGYVLSREAVRRFATDGLSNPKNCKPTGTGAEDAEMGICLNKIGVIAGDSRDHKGLHRMLPFSPLSHLQAGGNKSMPDWFHHYMFYPYTQGKECCSDYMISFHYVNKGVMYALDNLLYHIRPIGFIDELWANERKKKANEGKTVIEALKDLSTKTSPKT